jgi:hypothetical protein
MRRSGPLLAVVLNAAGNDAAQTLLSGITYNPNVSLTEEVVRNTPQDAARMILAIATLAAGLIVLATLLGVVFGGSRILAGKFGMQTAKEGFTTLHLGEK